MTPETGLYVPRDTRVHALPAHPKVLATVAFVAVVVATPPGWWGAMAGHAVLITAVLAVARVPVAVVLRRMLVETPVVVFAVLMPFVATGPRVEVLGASLSSAGLVGGATLLAKATLGVLAGITLAATTTARDLLAGLDRLGLPRQLLMIASFMVRYASVVTGDLQRMRIARLARGFTGGQLGHLRVEAAGAGALFVRSYERGERVHRAMLARGYTGRMPGLGSAAAGPRQWATAAVLPLAAGLVVASAAVVGQR